MANDIDAAKTSHNIMETVLNNLPAYIYVFDPQTNEIVFANEAYLRNFTTDPLAAEYGQSLHQEVVNYFDASPHDSEDTPVPKYRYFEIRLEAVNRWIGVHINSIAWIDERRMYLVNGRDITERKWQEEYIRRIAYIDHLTGLSNRYCCDADLDKVIAAARKSGSKGYVIFVDLDDFKIVNDGYGHDYGDALLIEFANFLKESRMENNRVFRFGGDEFVLLVDPSNEKHIYDIIDRLIKRARSPWKAMNKNFYCTVSVGVVGFPDGDMGVKEILKNADVAMYEAKRIGKNSFAFYTNAMRNDSIERTEMESMMRECINNNFAGFTACYQPYVDAVSGRILGAETLIRWLTPSSRVIMPCDFISLSEYLGLIVPIGEFVLTEACKLTKKVSDLGFKDFTCSVNISVRQMQQHDIIPRIEKILRSTGANPESLIFEITEGVAVKDLNRIQIICGELRKKGIRIAMDDFGVGYSSISNLRDMPIDIVKIDRSFIEKSSIDSYYASFIRLITDFGHSVNKQICIEGVETEDQLEYCRKAGADSIQGFYFYKPMPAKELINVLLER